MSDDDIKLSPTEKRLHFALSDGREHPRNELVNLLDDELGDPQTNVGRHISNMRRKLRRRGEDIVHVKGQSTTSYQLVRLFASAVDGKR